MKIPYTLLSLAAFSNAIAIPWLSSRATISKPLSFLLAGDSTTAPQTSGGGGWGNGFLNHTLKSPSTGKNLGHNGATTVSFRSGGDWANVLNYVKEEKGSYEVFVTIQFGHNDQKATANISLAEYSTNLGVFVDDVVSAGGTPILVTPLTRRSFSGSPPRIVENLANETAATIQVAQSKNARYIDLNRASTDYCNEIGPAACHVYNSNDSTDVEKLDGTDNTHLNVWGSDVFGRMVSDLMVAKYADIKAWMTPNATMSYDIAHGIAV